MPTLVYNPGEPDEKAFRIGDAAVTIGRGDDQTICIPHKSLSRSHARIEPSGDRIVIVDLQSKNGTFVNGARVQQQALRDGDTVTLGDLDLLMVAHPTHRDATAPFLEPLAVRPLMRAPITKLARRPDPSTPVDAGARVRARLRILIEVAKLLPVSDDADTLLQKILDLVFQILDVDHGAILLVDEQTQKLTPRIVRSPRPPPDGGPVFSQNIVDYVHRRSVAALFADAVSDPRLDAARSIVIQSIRASMCVPLKPKNDVIGVLYVDNRSSANVFTEEDLEFLVAFASQAAVALENAALYRRLERETVGRMQLIMDAKLTSLSAMVAGIAHEIRNPLNFMINFAALSEGLAGDVNEVLGEQRARLEPGVLVDLEDMLRNLRENSGRITEHGRRADTIIQGMLRHSRRSSSPREEGDLNAVVAESVRLARGGARDGDLAVRVVEEYDPAITPMEMAPLDIGRVFINLADNALYAMRQKKQALGEGYAPELRVRTADRGDQVEVRIRDNGTGIPPEIADQIYNPFFTTKPPGQGTGLGLSLSRDIVVEGHQGTIRMQSEPGEYTEIVVTLPRGAAGSVK